MMLDLWCFEIILQMDLLTDNANSGVAFATENDFLYAMWQCCDDDVTTASKVSSFMKSLAESRYD